MTRSDWTKKAQIAFNKFIRLRDARKPCICCGKPLTDGALTGGGYDAGHYRSTGSAPHLRFIEDNCHAQRKQCNQWGAGRAVRSEEHTSELQSLMRISYAVFCLKKKNNRPKT